MAYRCGNKIEERLPTSRHRLIGFHKPDSLYQICMHFVSRHIMNYLPSALEALPPVTKSELLLDVTLRGAASRCYKCPDTIPALLQKTIRRLDLRNHWAVSDKMIKDVVRLSPNLLEFRISGRSNSNLITSECLQQYIPKLRHLTALELSSLTCLNDEVLEAILIGCPNIENLDVGNCIKVTDKIGKLIKEMKIKGLNLSKTSITDHFLFELKDSVFNDHVEDINLSDCNVSSNGLMHVKWDNIKFVGIKNTALDDLEFTKHFRQLKFMEWTLYP